MAARFGNVLYWMANTVAVFMLVSGAIIGSAVLMHPSFGSHNAMLFPFAIAFGTWLFGRACLYVLAGR